MKRVIVACLWAVATVSSAMGERDFKGNDFGDSTISDSTVIGYYEGQTIGGYSDASIGNDSLCVMGRVWEEGTNKPIEGAIVYNVENNYLLGSSDKNGEFSVWMDAGRKIIRFVMIGYQSMAVEVDVRPITEFVSVALEVNPIEINEVSIVVSKPEPIGAKRFSPELTDRYAGSLGDPARMVRSFAGVQVMNDNRNDIIIRGNSPIGLQWRVDGFEIPNPNHHGAMGLTGSTVTLLNTNLLTNSDFYLGGWGANFSNVTSGIFDLTMRGQNDIKKRTHWGQVAWNGFELGTEGNFDKKKKTSYFADYRYSFLGLMDKIGLDMGNTPEYQDFTFKTTAQINDRHALSFLTIWGDSDIKLEGQDTFTNQSERVKTGSQTLLAGITHQFWIRSNQILSSKLSLVKSDVYTDVEEDTVPVWRENSTEIKYNFNSEYLHRFKEAKTLTVGVNLDMFDLNYNEAVYVNSAYRVTTDEDGNMALIRGFAQYQTYLAGIIKTTIGVNSSYLTLNGSYAIEPRLAMKYRINGAHSIAFATGMYSQMQPRPIYFIRNEQGVETNRNLGFTKNAQAILSYNWTLNSKWHLRAEAYYQYLYDVPVVDNPNSTLSLLNFGASYHIPRPDSLINKGTGYNYGIEISLERYFQNNFYILTNVSLYASKYTNGFNDKLYSTAFDGTYTFNISGGYEWNINKYNALLFDLKGSVAGGQRYTPLDEEASIAAGKEVFDYTKTNTKQLSVYLRGDFKITYRMNAPKFIQDFSIDFQNFTNHKNPHLVDYGFTSNSVVQTIHYQQGFVPMFTYKITF